MDQPSETMWCMVRSSTCSFLSAVAARRAPAVPGQVEGGERLSASQALRFGIRVGALPQVDDRQWERRGRHGREDALHRHALLRDQTGAQGSCRRTISARANRSAGNRGCPTGQGRPACCRWGWARFELIEKPQALLGEGERQRLIAPRAMGMWRAADSTAPSAAASRPAPCDPLGEVGDAGGFEEPAHRDGSHPGRRATERQAGWPTANGHRVRRSCRRCPAPVA